MNSASRESTGTDIRLTPLQAPCEVYPLFALIGRHLHESSSMYDLLIHRLTSVCRLLALASPKPDSYLPSSRINTAFISWFFCSSQSIPLPIREQNVCLNFSTDINSLDNIKGPFCSDIVQDNDGSAFFSRNNHREYAGLPPYFTRRCWSYSVPNVDRCFYFSGKYKHSLPIFIDLLFIGRPELEASGHQRLYPMFQSDQYRLF